MTTSDDDSLNRHKETKTEYGSVSGVTTTCSLKQTTAYNDSQTESGSGQYASGLVKTLTVRDGKKADSQSALSVYTLEYDAEGNAVKVTHGKPHKNALGDIDAIYDTDMNLVVEYVYDAWGNCTIEAAGTDNLAIMQLNPFRYRGYYWDKELNLYYLQTRYYDPETGRFINADGIEYALEQAQELNGLNLYAYCFNNPIMGVDEDGTIPKWLAWALTGLAIVAAVAVSIATVGIGAAVGATAIGFATGFTSSVVGQYHANGKDRSKVNFKMAAYDGLIGAVNGAIATTGVGLLGSVALGAVSGGMSSIGSDILFNDGEIQWDNFGWSVLGGAVAGLISGAGAKSDILKYKHSNNILNRTVKNNTVRHIARQALVRDKHIISILTSSFRFVLGNALTNLMLKFNK